MWYLLIFLRIINRSFFDSNRLNFLFIVVKDLLEITTIESSKIEIPSFAI